MPDATSTGSPGRALVGLVPAAGWAQRVPFLPCSKELFPVGFQDVEEGAPPPRAVCLHLLEQLRAAGARRAYIVLRAGKWDVPAYLRDGKAAGLALAYLMMDAPFGVPYTLDQAYPFVEEALVLFGFPDILFRPQGAFRRLLDRQAETGADLVLGLFPAPRPHKADMVAVDTEGRVRALTIKPAQTDLQYAWITAVWTPAFTRFMHDYVQAVSAERRARFASGRDELFLGHVIQAALERNMHVAAVTFTEGAYLDIGTPEELARAVRGEW